MRWTLGCIAGLIFLTSSGMTCCGVGEPYLQPITADDECSYLDCPLALGSEVFVAIQSYDSPQGQLVEASLDVPELAEVSVDRDRIVMYPRTLGQGVLSVKREDGYSFEAWVRTAARASTAVAPDHDVYRPTYPPGNLQLFAGSRLRVVAEHRNAAGERLVGHGLENWTITGGTLLEIAPDDFRDTALVRDVAAIGGSRITVTAHADGTPLELDVVPPLSTAKLGMIYKGSQVRLAEVSLGANEFAIAQVHAFSADGRYIHGSPGAAGSLTAGVTDETIVHVTADSSRRTLAFEGRKPGRSELTVRFDGVTSKLVVNVY